MSKMNFVIFRNPHLRFREEEFGGVVKLQSKMFIVNKKQYKLIEKVKNEAFIEDHQFYGRTAAFSSNLVSDVSVIYNFKIRYVINTEPKSITEEIVVLGIEIFSGNVIEESKMIQITKGKTDNHGKPEVLLKKHLQKALEFPDLDREIEKIKTERLESLIVERTALIKKLREQGLSTDLEGINKIDVVGTDLLTITLVYPMEMK